MDQVVSSATNVLPLLPLASTVPPREFGSIALVGAVVVGLLAMIRAYYGSPMLSSPDSASEVEHRIRPHAVAASRTAAVLAAVLIVLLVAFAEGDVLVYGVLMSLGLVPAAFVDTARPGSYRSDRGESALVRDLAWLGVELTLIGLAFFDRSNAFVYLALCWPLGAVGAFLARRPRATGAVAVRNSAAGRPFLTEMILLSIRNQAWLLVVAAVTSVEEAGAVRYALVLLAPVTTVHTGWRNAVVARGLNRGVNTPAAADYLPAAVTLTLLPLVVFLASKHVPRAIIGDTAADKYLLAAALVAALSGVDLMMQARLLMSQRFWLLTASRVGEVLAWMALLVVTGLADLPLQRSMVAAAAVASGLWLSMAFWSSKTKPIQRHGATIRS